MKQPTDSHSGRTAKETGEYDLSDYNTDDAHFILMEPGLYETQP